MKILQKIVLSVALATSMVAFSTNTIAAEKKEVVSVQSLIETTISHIEAAIAATDKDEILAHIKDARQTQKDIIVGALDQDRQKASKILGDARNLVIEGKDKEAEAKLNEAVTAYKALLEASKK